MQNLGQFLGKERLFGWFLSTITHFAVSDNLDDILSQPKCVGSASLLFWWFISMFLAQVVFGDLIFKYF